MTERPPKVLIVDDDRFLMRYYTHELTDSGFEVSLASTSTEGYELAKTGSFDIIVLDIMMSHGELFDEIETAGGVETGLSLARRILKEGTRSKIVLFSISPSPAGRAWASKQARVTYLSKSDVLPNEFVEELRSLLTDSSEPLGNQKPRLGAPMIQHCDVAILTALPKELDSVLAQHSGWETIDAQATVRKYHRTVSANGLVIIAAQALGMGQLNAALLTADVLAEWNPSKVILVGIAAGLGPEVNLGDVVISEQIVDYEIGKVTSAGLTPRWSVYQSDPSLLSSIHSFANTPWARKAAICRPDNRLPADSKSHLGVVLSGNKVIADEETAGALKSVWQRAAAIEMESAGVSAALYQRRDKVGFIMIKGICDRADSAKNDSWQDYAAQIAAAFSWQFIETLSRSAVSKISPEIGETEFGIPSRALRLALSGAYNLAELKGLASDLEVDWDDIAGQTKSEKIVDLLSYLKRRGRLQELVQMIRVDRSGLLQSFRA